jgi:predicted cupin superfamily sugar epimerase
MTSIKPSVNAETLSLIRPTYHPSTGDESPRIQSTIQALNLIPHVEGGYFALTDTSPGSIPSPYPQTPLSEATIAATGGIREGYDPAIRLMSTTIFYYLTPNRPQGSFHMNRSRIIHTLHRGRGRYVLIHPDGRVESFNVGQNIENGEKLQWIVEGGVWKASFLLDVEDENGNTQENEGLLISETVVPGFEYSDHEFLSSGRSRIILAPETAARLEWLVNKVDHVTTVEQS